jgi:hypothetical protein
MSAPDKLGRELLTPIPGSLDKKRSNDATLEEPPRRLRGFSVVFLFSVVSRTKTKKTTENKKTNQKNCFFSGASFFTDGRRSFKMELGRDKFINYTVFIKI